MDWELLHTFSIALEQGSLAGTARALGCERATIRRRLDALEVSAGSPLFHRTADGLVPTEVGSALAVEVRRMARAAEAADRAVAEATSPFSGTVRLTFPPALARWVVECTAAVLQRHPDLRVELVSTVRHLDIDAREASLAIRLRPEGAPVGSDDTITRKLRHLPFSVYVPATWEDPVDLESAPYIGFNDTAPGDPIADVLATFESRPRMVASVNEMEDAATLVRAGLGWSVLGDVGAWPGTRRLFEAPYALTMWLAIRADQRALPRARLLIDALASL